MNNLAIAKKSKYFKELEQMDFNAMLRCLSVRIKEYKAGEIIDYEGNPAKYAYIVLTGRARTASFDEHGVAIPELDYTKDMIYGLEYPSDKSGFYKEEFFAVEDSKIMICDLYKLLNPCENKCNRHSIIVSKCINELSNTIERTKKRIKELAQSKTRNKVLTYLSHALPKYDKPYTIPYNRQEMADYLGVERSALSVELSKLQKEGYIEFHKSTFIKKRKN